MNTQRIALALGALAIVFATPASAQVNTFTKTTISQAQAATDKYVCLTSATAIVLPSTFAGGSRLVIDREPEDIQLATPWSTSCFYVLRAKRPYAHNSGALAVIGQGNWFQAIEPPGGEGAPCVSTSQNADYWINLGNGNIYSCDNSKWTPVNSYDTAVTAKASAQLDATSSTTGTTLTSVPGMSIHLIPGTYRYTVNVAGVTTANAGSKLAFKYSTVPSAVDYTAKAYTASAVAVTHGTTTTDQTLIMDNTAGVVISTEISGTVTFTAAGTVALQAGQHTSHADTESVYAGSSMTFQLVK